MFVRFNRPPMGGEDRAVQQLLLSAFRATQKGSRVFGGMYKWNDEGVTEEIDSIRESRDLDLNVAAGTAEVEPSDSIKRIINRWPKSCILQKDPDGMLNHTKFFVFDALNFEYLKAMCPDAASGQMLDGFGTALYLSSANITEYDEDFGDREKHNAAVITAVTSEQVDGLWDYWKDLHGEYTRPPTHLGRGGMKVNLQESRYRILESNRTKVYLFPRRDPATDTIVGILDNVQVEGSSPCEIRIVTARWTSGRIAVAEKLAALHKQGAKVSIVCRPTSTGDLSEDVEAILKTCARVHYQADGVNIHSKYLLIDAQYKQDDGHYRQQRLVWMGTPNMTGDAIDEHWEMLLKLKHDTGLYKYFRDDYDYLASVPRTHT
jgi:hypothetical protein